MVRGPTCMIRSGQPGPGSKLPDVLPGADVFDGVGERPDRHTEACGGEAPGGKRLPGAQPGAQPIVGTVENREGGSQLGQGWLLDDQILTDDLSPVDPGSRQPFQGSLGQLVDDIGELAGAGVEHVFLTLPLAVREKGALLDASAELIARVREAGL